MPDKLLPFYQPFSAGIDTQSHPYNIRAPYLRHAINVDYRRDIGPQKREGIKSLPAEIMGGGSISNGGQVLQCGDELLCCDDQAVYSWSPQAQRWVARGELRPTVASTRPTAVSGAAVKACSGASIPALGLEGVAWTDANGLHVSMQDVATGTRIIDDVVVATGRSNIRLVATSATMVVFSTDATGAIYSAPLLPSQGTIGPETVIVAAPGTGGPTLLDVAYDASTDGFALAYIPTNTGTYNLLGLRPTGTAFPQPTRSQSYELLQAGSNYGVYNPPTRATQITSLCIATAAQGFNNVFPTYVVVRGYASPGAVGQAPTSGGVLIEYRFGSMVTPGTSYSGLGVAPGTTLSNAVVNVTATVNPLAQSVNVYGSAQVYDALYPGAAVAYQLISFAIDATKPAGSATTTGPTLNGAALLSRPFTLASGRTVAWMMSYATVSGLTASSPTLNTPTAYLYDLTSRTIQARLAAGIVDPNTMLGGPQTPFSRGSSMAVSALLQTRLVTALGTANSASLVPQSGAYDLIVQSTTGSALQSAVLDNAALFAGGAVYHYDGASVVEAGFYAPPDLYVIGPSANGAMGAGTFGYVAVWEWYDARGRRHRSAPSRVVTVTQASGTTTGSVNLRVQPLQLTRRKNVALVIYRTTANGIVYYQVTDSSNPYLNNQAVTFMYPVDTLADSVILGNEPIYTGGGELPNDPPPASTVALRARGRVMLAGGEYRDTVTYSKQNDLSQGVQFSLALQKRVTAVPGDIVAMAAIDDKVIVFKTQGICAFAGTGVTAAGVASGNNDDFSDPVILSTDLWCVAPNSVVTASEGVYFKSQKGYYLMDRGFAFTYIGAAAETYNAQNVRSAVVHPTLGHLRVGCLEDTGLVYHPRKVQAFGDAAPQAGAWTTYSNWGHVSACTWQGQYVMLRANGRVLVQSATYDDDGAAIVQSLRTSWITGSQPLQAVRFGTLAVIGELTSPHRLQVDLCISYDSNPVARFYYDSVASSTPTAWGADATWGASAGWGGDSIGTYIFRCREIPEQVMGASSLQWIFSDATRPGTPLQRSASLHGYAMLVEPLAALPSLPDKQSL